MEAVTDVVFRHVIARASPPDVYYTEFTNATGWVHAGQKAIGGRLIKTNDEKPIVAQIWGGEPGDMASLAEHCADMGYDGIDINMGCPAKSAIKSGGSALIRDPELAIASIAAAKTAGLPVSVKTRLGYTHVDEWRGWLTTLLQQDIVALTIHLRTKKEMSKVPAHWELMTQIRELRDQVAPQTLLIGNGDVMTRAQGLALIELHVIDGVMIGRGVFHDPFVFEKKFIERGKMEDGEPQITNSHIPIARADHINLLRYHLDLFDQYHTQTGRPFDTLKRFFKIYIRDFEGAAEVRDRLMHASSTDQVRAILDTID